MHMHLNAIAVSVLSCCGIEVDAAPLVFHSALFSNPHCIELSSSPLSISAPHLILSTSSCLPDSHSCIHPHTISPTPHRPRSPNMPHATDVVNGDSSSKTVSHLKSYPVVSDSIETFKSNSYGKKSLEIVDNAYTRFAKPVEPYLEKPYSYAKPYVSKADELADSALGHVDGHFPIVKEDAGKIYEKAKTTAFWPYTYLSETWNDEYTKTANHSSRGPGVTTSVLSIISLELRIASDFFHYVADTLKPAYEEGKAKADELTKGAQQTLGEYEKYGKEKLGQLQSEASKKGEELKSKAGDAKAEAEKKVDDVKGKAEKTKDDAQKKLQK